MSTSVVTKELVIELLHRDDVRQVGRVPLPIGKHTIGTSIEANVRLAGNRVAPLQAELDVRADGAVLINRDAQFGLTLNGELMLTDRPTELLDGAVLQIHVFRLTYRVVGEATETTPLASTEQAPEQPEPIEPAQPARAVKKLQPLDSPYSRYEVVGEMSRYLRELPAIYQGEGSGFLGRYLRIFEAIWEPFEQRQSQISMYFDPRTCPATLLPMLEHWLAVPFGAHWPEARRRQLIAQAADLYRWRGTSDALSRAIAIYTGVVPSIAADPVEPFVIEIDPHVLIEQPADWEALRMLIEQFKPAHVAYRLLGRDASVEA